MIRPTKCLTCPLRTAAGRCSFQRLIRIGLRCGCVLDYRESPRHIVITTRYTTVILEPEEARDYLCRLLSEKECARAAV